MQEAEKEVQVLVNITCFCLVIETASRIAQEKEHCQDNEKIQEIKLST
jgi:hypothetical protein